MGGKICIEINKLTILPIATQLQFLLDLLRPKLRSTGY